jgi:hypothetical protein
MAGGGLVALDEGIDLGRVDRVGQPRKALRRAILDQIEDRIQPLEPSGRLGPKPPIALDRLWPGRDAGGGQLSGMINLDDGFPAPRSRLRQA